MSTETPEKTEDKVDIVQIELEARWSVEVPLSEFPDDVSYEDDKDMEEWLHENTDKVLDALDLKLIQGDQPIEVGFGGTDLYQGVPEPTTEWPDRDPRDSAPYLGPVPSYVSRFNLSTGERPETSPINDWSDQRVQGAVDAMGFALSFCSIGERQKSNFMPFWYEVLHAVYSRPALHNFVPRDIDTDGNDGTACLYCTQAADLHTGLESTTDAD